MRVYHYLGTKWALDDIRRHRLKLSTIDEMNDPYEWECVRSSDQGSQLALKATKAEIVGMHGALCFSRSWNNILMWSHYGDRHKGICLGFDLPDAAGKYWETKYLKEMVVAPDLSSLPQIQQKPFIELLYTGKYQGWSYEEEVRTYGRRAERDEETGQYFVSFDQDLELREVIAGARFPFSRKPIDDALRGYLNITVAKAVASGHKFDLVLDKDGFKDSL